jgi:hypothetical protein
MHVENQQAQLEAIAEGQLGGSDGVHNSGARPSDSPYYNRIFWASYKGQSRGMWGGILLGCALGAGAGIALAGVIAMMSGVGMTAALVLPMIGIGSLGGMVYAKEMFGVSGAVAGAVAAGMEISEERRHMEELARSAGVPLVVDANGTVHMDEHKLVSKMASGEIPYQGNETTSLFGAKHHEYGERPSFFSSVAVAGAAIGALFGGVMALVGGGMVGGLEHLPVFEHMFSSGGPLVNVTPAMQASIAQATVVGGTALVGATYGINRHYFRKFFNISNDMYDGKLGEILQGQGKVLAPAPALAAVAATQPPMIGSIFNNGIAPSTPEPQILTEDFPVTAPTPSETSLATGAKNELAQQAALIKSLTASKVAAGASGLSEPIIAAAALGATASAASMREEPTPETAPHLSETPRARINTVAFTERQQAAMEPQFIQHG